MTSSATDRAADGITLIDHRFLGVPGVIGSYLVADGDALALIETGPTTTIDTLIAGIQEAGHDPAAIMDVLVTHIHLDHAGAAGTLLRRLPRARLHVHALGAPHLADPSKLIASATRIYGDRMEELWGEILPVPRERLVVAEDGAGIRVGGRVLRAMDTPGHAAHHLAFHDPETATVFTGDVGAVRLAGAAYVRPPTPPPELDLAAWLRSVSRIRALRPDRLALTHFGVYEGADEHLDALIARLFAWAGWTEASLAAGSDTAAVTEQLRARGDAEIRPLADGVGVGGEDLVRAYELATNYRMTVDGFARYFRKRAG